MHLKLIGLLLTWKLSEFRKAHGSSLELQKMSYIILDLEASCWQNEGITREQEVIELAACMVNSYGDLVKKFNRIVKPVIHPRLSQYCKQLTGISQSDVDKAKEYDSVIYDFLEWSDWEAEPLDVFTWGNKDYELICNMNKYYKMESDWCKPFTDMKYAYAKLMNLNKPVGLDKALLAEGFEFEGERHRALPDAYNLSKLFVKYIEEWTV